MRSTLQFAAALLLAAIAATPVRAQIHSPQINLKKKEKRENLEWLWQYSPTDKDKDGRQNELLQDPRFQPFLAHHLTAPQAFWGPAEAPRKSLADTAFDFLAVPGQVLADQDRYLTITGCVYHFCSNRGLLWVDLNQSTVLFAAIDWTTEDRTPDDPASTYTLWVFADQTLSPTPEAPNRIPPAFLAAIRRWTAQPTPGSHHLQHITTAVLVDPDGTPHTLPPATLGVTTQTETPKEKAQP
jgi:hypothetical protein